MQITITTYDNRLSNASEFHVREVLSKIADRYEKGDRSGELTVHASTVNWSIDKDNGGKQEARRVLSRALGRANDCGLLDTLAEVLHPDAINGFCDAVDLVDPE